MPSWDRPRSGGDRGSDKPPTPQLPRDVGQPGEVGDYSRRRGDITRVTDGSTDKSSATSKQYQTLFERQRQIIDVQKQRVDTQNAEITRLEKRNEKLEERNEKLETRLEQRDQIIDRQANEIDRLKAENAELREKVRGGEGDSAVGRTAAVVSRDDKVEARSAPDTPWYRKFPSEKLVGIGTTVAGLGQAIASYSGHMSSAESGLITASIGVGVSILGYAREKYTERKAKNADRPEN